MNALSRFSLLARRRGISSKLGQELLLRCEQMIEGDLVAGATARRFFGVRGNPAMSLDESHPTEERVILKAARRIQDSLPLVWGIGEGLQEGLRMPVFYAVAGLQRPDMFGLTQKLRLTERPRVLYMGTYRDGAGLSLFLEAIRKILGGQGEAVLINGAAFRDQLAPVVAHLRLGGQVVFAPPLSQEELAALYQSADVLVYSERQPEGLHGLIDVFANGLPVILADTFKARVMVGYPTLLVDPDQPDIWPDALREVLENGRLRERLIGRGLDYAAPHLMPVVVDAWREAIKRVGRGDLFENTHD